MRRFYAPSESHTEGQITLELEETRHIRDVLRLRAGDHVRVFDGNGREFSTIIQTIEKRSTVLKILEEVPAAAPESSLGLTLAVALLKGEKFDLVVQKAVELGVAAIVPLNTVRSDVRLKEPGKKIDRWRRIVLEASKQCGRARLMAVEMPVDFDNFIEGNRDAILFAEKGGAIYASELLKNKITAIVGPEGGWESSEIEFAESKDVQIVTLGGRILRAETAAIAVAAILQHDFGDLK